MGREALRIVMLGASASFPTPDGRSVVSASLEVFPERLLRNPQTDARPLLGQYNWVERKHANPVGKHFRFIPSFFHLFYNFIEHLLYEEKSLGLLRYQTMNPQSSIPATHTCCFLSVPTKSDLPLRNHRHTKANGLGGADPAFQLPACTWTQSGQSLGSAFLDTVIGPGMDTWPV